MNMQVYRQGLAMLCGFCLVLTVQPVVAQVSGTGNRNTSNAAGGSGTTAGFGGSGVSTQGFSLSSRFAGNFGRFTGGSQSIGQTTAGAAAATSGVFGQSAGSNLLGASLLSNGGRLGNFGRSYGAGLGASLGSNRNGRNAGTAGRSANGQKVIRTHLRLGFPQPKFASAAVAQRTTTVISKVLLREKYAKSPITVRIEGRTAVLTGTVETEYASDVARRLALLEPGISAVRNELTVGPGVPTGAIAPKANSVDQRP